MNHEGVSITIDDREIWERRMARLRVLGSVNKPRHHATSKFRVDLQLRAVVKEGDVDNFIEALERYSAEEGVSLSDIMDMKGPSGSSLLHVAAGIEKDDILRALLKVIQDKLLATKVNDRGDTALHIAARAGRISTATLLVDDTADTTELLVNVDSIVELVNDAGNTALHEAVKNCHSDLIPLLLNGCSRLVYQKNKESKCPLYLAVETEKPEILRLLIEAVKDRELPPSQMEGMSPVHGAVMHENLEMLKEMSKWKKELFDLRDARDGTPLHLAAYENFIDGVKFLVDEFASSIFERDVQGYLPIHVACKMGHLKTIKELLQHWPHTEEMLTSNEGQNILHVAAKYGRASIVKYILGEPRHCEKLINAKDMEGNTPLHVATLHWQPEVLLSLSRHKKVDRKLVNNSNLTALDIVDVQLKEIDAPLRKSLTRVILVSAQVPRSKDKAICQPKSLGPGRYLKPPSVDRLKDTAETRMIVATLVAAMTFAAGLSVPGGYNSSEPDAGIATLFNKPMYDVFVICNTVAMYSSIIAIVILLWTQINDSVAVHHALIYARLPLLIALATMSVAFMAGVYVTISKRTWIAIVALIIGITGLFIILGLYIAMFVPLGCKCRLVQLFTDYFIKVGISISGSVTEVRAIRPDHFGNADNEPWQPKYTEELLCPTPEPTYLGVENTSGEQEYLRVKNISDKEDFSLQHLRVENISREVHSSNASWMRQGNFSFNTSLVMCEDSSFNTSLVCKDDSSSLMMCAAEPFQEEDDSPNESSI